MYEVCNSAPNLKQPIAVSDGNYTYRAYGLTITSHIELPELTPSTGAPDLHIKIESVPHSPLAQQAPDGFIQAAAGQTLLLLGEYVGANLLVRNGNEILVEMTQPEKVEEIRLAILGFGLTALLFQRGYLVLHGNAIQTVGGAIAVCGQQRAGKSTLTTALYKRGFNIIADDLAAVDLWSAVPVVMPGFPRLKLWKDTLEYFDEPIDSLQPIQPSVEKYNFPLNGSFHCRPEPLNALYILKKSDTDRPRIRHLTGIEKFWAICSQIRSYKPEHLPHGDRWLLQSCSSLAEKIRVAYIERPINGNSIDAVANLVTQDLVPQDLDSQEMVTEELAVVTNSSVKSSRQHVSYELN
ncbi:MAG: hypothetical protein AAF702_48640 [Chloroflexota bacterium]